MDKNMHIYKHLSKHNIIAMKHVLFILELECAKTIHFPKECKS